MSIPIRRAAAADIPVMHDIELASRTAAHWHPVAYDSIFSTDCGIPRIALVAELDGAVAGFIIGRVVAGACELENIAVSDACLRRGAGRALTQALLANARTAGASEVWLEVRESNFPARKLYENCGFALTGRRRGYYQNPEEDAILYSFSTPASTRESG